MGLLAACQVLLTRLLPGLRLFPLQGALAAIMGTPVSTHANRTLPNVGHRREVQVSTRLTIMESIATVLVRYKPF